MRLDIRQLARGLMVSEYDDPTPTGYANEDPEEVDIRKLRRGYADTHITHARPDHCRNQIVSLGRADTPVLKPHL